MLPYHAGSLHDRIDAGSGGQMIRFTCPYNSDHSDFYLRRQSSEAWRVSPQGGIATKETRNSYDGEGDTPVYCSDCDDVAYYEQKVLNIAPIRTPVECVDHTSEGKMFEDESL